MYKKSGVYMIQTMEQANEFFQNRKQYGIKPGLDRIKQLLQYLNHPEEKMTAIHVAGTNGKGSTIAFLKNALVNNEYQVGVFTSPSMTGLTGHIFLNHNEIPMRIFIKILNDMLPSIQTMDNQGAHATEFEIMTALAFMYFKDHVDIAIIETGMGGREDTTNCFNPLLSIITNISKDHTAYLGNTLKKIAWHKAGIIKDNIPVILGEMQFEVRNIFQEEAQIKNAPVHRLKKNFTYSHPEILEDGQAFLWSDQNHSMRVSLTMNGIHQVKNCSTVIKALLLLEKRGFTLEWHKVLDAFYQTQVEGRFETIMTSPTIILDGAHNPAGIESFLQTVAATNHTESKSLILGVFEDKELDKMIHLCIPYFDMITLVPFQHPRAAGYHTLTKFVENKNVIVKKNWKILLTSILNQSTHVTTYYVAGSLNFISQVRSFFKSKQ